MRDWFDGPWMIAVCALIVGALTLAIMYYLSQNPLGG